MATYDKKFHESVRKIPNYTAIGAGIGGFYATATPGPNWKLSLYRGAAYTGAGALAGMGVGAAHRQVNKFRAGTNQNFYYRKTNGKTQRVRKGRR